MVALGPCARHCRAATQGETEAEARDLIQDAVRLHVEARLAAGELIYQEVGTTTVRIAV